MAKKPGIFNDPWRSAAPAPVEKPKAAPAPTATTADPDSDDFSTAKRSAIVLKDYGGISVKGSYDRKQVAIQLIGFCVEHLTKIEDILTQYGILVTQLEPGKLDTPIFIQQEDGWTLTVPFAKDKPQAILQLIQALLEMDSRPALRTLLREYKLQPFKL